MHNGLEIHIRLKMENLLLEHFQSISTAFQMRKVKSYRPTPKYYFCYISPSLSHCGPLALHWEMVTERQLDTSESVVHSAFALAL